MANRKESQVFCGDPDRLALGLLNNDFLFDPGQPDFKGGAYTLRIWREDYYHWHSGYWNRLTDAEMRRRIAEHIHMINEQVGVAEEEKITITGNRVNNILLNLLGRVGIPEVRELNTWDDGREVFYTTIAFNNGLLLLHRTQEEEPTLAQHTPSYFGVTKLPFDYDPDAGCDEWLKFLDDIMLRNDEYIALLQEWVGYLLRPDLCEQKFLLCVGPGSNGKGTFTEVVQSLIGKDNCSEISIARLADRFALVGTLNKLLNATSESSHIISDQAENVLKSFVAGDRFTFDRKFREPLFNVQPTAKLMISTNSLPRFNDKTEGVWRRILLCPFDKVIAADEQIKQLAKQLKTELPGVFNWALAGLKRLNKSGFTVPETTGGLLEEYRRDSDPARAFLLETYTGSLNGDGTSCAEVYAAYVRYCEEGRYKAMASRTFGRQVSRLFPNAKRRRIGTGEGRQYEYVGLIPHQPYQHSTGK